MTRRVVVLISGQGSNLQALLDACGQNPYQPQSDPLPARVVGVLSNQATAPGLDRARACGVPTASVSHADYPERAQFDAALIPLIDAWQPDLVVLAGFMRILTVDFVRYYQRRLMNIHPSLLPRHKGLNTHARALAAGDTEHGCTVHWVTEELDGGPVIAQAKTPVHADDTPATLAARVHQLEHQLLPQVLRAWAQSALETPS